MSPNKPVPAPAFPGDPLVPGHPCPATARYRTQTPGGLPTGKEYDCRKGRTMPPTPGPGEWFLQLP